MSDRRQHTAKIDWMPAGMAVPPDSRWAKSRLARNRRRAEPAIIAEQLGDCDCCPACAGGRLDECFMSVELPEDCQTCGGECNGLGVWTVVP